MPIAPMKGFLVAAALFCSAPLALAQTPPAQSAAPAADVKTETGEIDGAKFRIDVPTK